MNSAQICFLKVLMLPNSFPNTWYSKYDICQWRIFWATVWLTKCENRCSIKNCHCTYKLWNKGEDEDEDSTHLLGNEAYTKSGLGLPLLSIYTDKPWHLSVFTYGGREHTEETTTGRQRTVKGNCNRISIYSKDVKPLLALTHSFLVQDDKLSDVSSRAF